MEIKLPFIMDGANGTAIQKRGFKGDMSPEAWILDHPEIFQEIQREYVRAGSNGVYAPTFGSNSVKMKEYGLLDKMAEFNHGLVEVSKAIMDGSDFSAAVMGDLTGVGKFLYPMGDTKFEELYEIYREQAQLLEEAGVDMFGVETMMTVPETRAAVLAIRDVSDKPILVSMTCNDKGKTMTGTDVCAGLVIFQGMGVMAYGLNCSSGPDMMIGQIKRLAEYAEVPLVAKPNAGLPELVDGEAIYNCPPEEFVKYVDDMLAAGVGFFGGCCGTEACHIEALKAALEGKSVAEPGSAHRGEIVVATERGAFVIDEDAEFSEVLVVGEDFEDDVDEVLEEEPDVLMLDIKDEDDIEYFAENQYLLRVPVCFVIEDAEVLDKALFQYQGRAMYKGSLGEEELKPLVDRYGLVVIE